MVHKIPKKDHALTHDENRSKICLFCLKKRGRNGCHEVRKIIKNGNVETLVQYIFNPSTYDADDPSLPNGVCKTCLKKLYVSNSKKKKLLEKPTVSFNYKSIETRQSEKLLACSCLICQLARERPGTSIKKNLPTKILEVTNNKLKGEASIESHESKRSYRCDDCFSKIARGKPHTCNTTTRIKNVQSLISESTPTVQNQIISSTLKNEMILTDKNTLSVNQVRGKPLKIYVNPKNSNSVEKSKTIITATDMQNIQTKYGLSLNVTTGIASDLRVATKNRKLIEPKLEKNLSANIHALDDFFDTKVYKFKKSVKIEKKDDKITTTEEASTNSKKTNNLECSKVKEICEAEQTSSTSKKYIKSKTKQNKQTTSTSKKSIKSKPKKTKVSPKVVKKVKKVKKNVRSKTKKSVLNSDVEKTEKKSKKSEESKIKKKYEIIETEQIQTAVYCKDLHGLIEYVRKKRNFSNMRLKFGIDGGGGSLKVCLSIQSIDNEFEPPPTKRRKYSDDIPSKLFQDSGVKKLFIIGLVQNVQENYDNVKQLWSDIKIDEIDGKVSADLKLCNIMVGIMPCSSSYPCTWCEVSKENLENSSTLRTIKNITDNYIQWINAGGEKESAKNFKCCISKPIFDCDEEKPILDILALPELHLYLGVINGLFTNMSKKFESAALSWAKACNVERQVSFGFNGNNCKQLLKKLDVLRQSCPDECQKYVQAFSDFKIVVDSCFSKTLNFEFEKHIENLKKSYLALGITVTPKVHCIFVHVKEFCKKHGVGLGIFSEQAFESVHHEFKSTWNKYLVKVNHPDYDKKLFRAVCEFNGLHV